MESSPLYRLLTRGRLRLVLEGIESRLRSSGKTEQTVAPKNMTIEHVMPVGWATDHWALPDGADVEAAALERKTLIHTVGNLTLVAGRLNSSMSNSSWENKRDGLLEHSVLLLNNELMGEPNWDENAIWRRSRRLAKLVAEVWPGPDSGEWQ